MSESVELLGHRWLFLPSGVAYWEEQRLAVVSDLHFSKGASLASTGQFLPPYDSDKTLTQLRNELESLSVRKVIFLGDSFHDDLGEDYLNKAAPALLSQIENSYEIIWISGNHDQELKGKPSYQEYTVFPFIFRHEPSNPDDLNEENFEISGHLHPKATVTIRGRSIRRPCFLKTERQLIMPAFGVLTGGLDLSSNSFRDILTSDSIAYLLREQKVLKIKLSPTLSL